MNEIKVSFVIPHKGREEMLLQTLRSIQKQAFQAERLEIILISQNESLSSELNSLIMELPIQLIRCTDGRTISALRNLGVSYAQGRYLAFLDADVALSANWLNTMFATLQRPGTVLASAYQVNAQGAPPLEQIRTALSNAEVDCTVTFLPGRNLFLKRDTFAQVGGFPEHLITCEDYYFTQRASQLGDLYYTSKASYVHLGEDKEYLEMFQKEIWRGQSNLASIKGREIPLREWASLLIPLGLLGLVLVVVISALLGSWKISLLSVLLLCLPVAVYSVRLKGLLHADVAFADILKFYGLYFPARAIGTISGVLKEVKKTT